MRASPWLIAALFSAYFSSFLPQLFAQDIPIYLEKYTITKIYFEGAGTLNRYYIFRFLQFKEGDTFTPRQLELRISDSESAMRTQWYFQASFQPQYFNDGRVEIYVLIEPTPKRFGFMGGTPDRHSFYLGFLGERRAPGSAFRFSIGKVIGLGWFFPYLGNSSFGLNIFAESKDVSFLENFDINQITAYRFWARGGLEEFVQPRIGIKFGLAQQFWATFQVGSTQFLWDVVLGAYADFNGLHLLKSRHWGMQFGLRIDVGMIYGMLLLRSNYELALLPIRWFEIDIQASATANLFTRLNIGALMPQIPSIDVLNSSHDLNVLARLRPLFLFSHNDYDNRSTFNLGFAVEGKFGLSLSAFSQPEAPLSFAFEVQGGFVLDVLTPGSFTTRFFFLAGANLSSIKPAAEFLVETRF